MPWARLDDGFHDHPKVDGLSLAAVGLWTLCWSHAHRHRKTAPVPGHVAEARVRKLAGKHADVLAAELVNAGMWEPAAIGGWLIHDFTDYLPKQRDPDERKEAGRKGAATRWQTASKPHGKLPSSSVASDSSRASAPASPSRPDPNVELHQGGDRYETPRAAAASKPTQTTPSDARCTIHAGVADPPPCNGCRVARERAETAAARVDEIAQRRREDAIRACPDCHGGIWLDNGTKCDHRRAAS